MKKSILYSAFKIHWQRKHALFIRILPIMGDTKIYLVHIIISWPKIPGIKVILNKDLLNQIL